MKFSVLTLFPDFVESVASFSILKKALNKNLLRLETINIRDFSTDSYHTVDDHPYGGGAGMILKIDVLDKALGSVKKESKGVKTVLLDARGERFTQKKAQEFSQLDQLIIVSGHYESVDERINEYIDEKISLGDFILTGGEIAAMAVVDAVGRLVPGVINKNSLQEESEPPFYYEYPQYTRPEVYKGSKVPQVLLSGNHAEIKKWRKENSLRNKKLRVE